MTKLEKFEFTGGSTTISPDFEISGEETLVKESINKFQDVTHLYGNGNEPPKIKTKLYLIILSSILGAIALIMIIIFIILKIKN